MIDSFYGQSYLLITLFLLTNATIVVLFKAIALGPGGSSNLALAPDNGGRWWITQQRKFRSNHG